MKDFEEDKNLRKQVQLGIEEEIELNHLKKVNKKMNLLRNIIFSILFIIAVILLVVFIRYNKVNGIINKVNNHVKEISNSDNYIFIRKTYETNYKENRTMEAEDKYFYKDGKYKLESNIKDNNHYKEIPQSTTKYFKDNEFSYIAIYHNRKSIELRDNVYEYKKGRILDFSNPFRSYTVPKRFYSIMYDLTKLIYEVRTDYFNNEECYVVRTSNSSNGYREVWISKKNYFVVREIDECFDVYYREYTYSLVFDQVTDEDVDSSHLSEIYIDYDIKLGEQN